MRRVPDSARMGGVIILTLIVGLALLAALLKSRAQKPGPQDTPHDTGSAVPSPAPEQRETPSTPSPAQGVPQHLPVQAKRYFFARSEQAFYGQLLRTLPQGYAIFPNVRLNDLFLIRAEGAERQATYNRLRDKHVDFVLVELPDYRPRLAIELDGPSHRAAQQQARDAVKNVMRR